MKADEIRKLLVKELQSNPELYEESVVPSLIDSGIKSYYIVSTYLELIGAKMSKAQANYLCQYDIEREKKEKEAKKKAIETKATIEKRLGEWTQNDGKVYSVNDFPEWILKRIGGDKEKTEEIVNEAIEEILRKSKLLTTPNTRDIPNQYLIVDGKALFSAKGYEYLIMQSRGYGWVIQPEQKKWCEESGACKTFKCYGDIPQLGSSPAK